MERPTNINSSDPILSKLGLPGIEYKLQPYSMGMEHRKETRGKELKLWETKPSLLHYFLLTPTQPFNEKSVADIFESTQDGGRRSFWISYA